jgi:hypothetical protein
MPDANELVFFGRHEIDPRTLLFYEWLQRLESGYPIAEFESEVRALVAADHAEPAEFWAVFDRLESAERDPDWGFDESETAAPRSVMRPVAPIPELFERIHGGWLGRCVGCTLGKHSARASRRGYAR